MEINLKKKIHYVMYTYDLSQLYRKLKLSTNLYFPIKICNNIIYYRNSMFKITYIEFTMFNYFMLEKIAKYW